MPLVLLSVWPSEVLSISACRYYSRYRRRYRRRCSCRYHHGDRYVAGVGAVIGIAGIDVGTAGGSAFGIVVGIATADGTVVGTEFDLAVGISGGTAIVIDLDATLLVMLSVYHGRYCHRYRHRC